MGHDGDGGNNQIDETSDQQGTNEEVGEDVNRIGTCIKKEIHERGHRDRRARTTFGSMNCSILGTF